MVRKASHCILNPRPAGVWLVASNTSCWGGGGGAKPHLRSPKLPDRFPKFDLEVTNDATGQIKVEIFDFSGLLTSASKISMLSASAKPMNPHG